jgi:PAS domain S-box-containing protein
VRCDQWLAMMEELNIGAFTVNRNHRITAINLCAQAMIGMRAAEVIGRDCREVFTGVPCLSRCSLMEGDAAPDPITAQAGGALEETRPLVTRLATPIYDAAGRVSGCFTILQDHSPISELIERLRHDERTLHRILDSLAIGVFTVNRGGLITFFNTAAEKISGYRRDEVLGLPCTTLFDGEASEALCLLRASMAEGVSRSRQAGRIVDRDGMAVPIRADYMALRDEKGTIIGGLATFQDLTLERQLDQVIHQRYRCADMIGKSPAMQKIFEMVPVVAASDATLLIEGPTGTGKDLLARVIHSASRRGGGPMVKVNCAAIPDSLIESEIFGYARGAFTGAERDKPGRFQEADGGTIFLDEIGDLPLGLQAKLLRVLEEREFYPLGSRRTVKVDVRIISATNRDLSGMVHDRQFREDLFYRLNVLRIELPPLARRPDDLPLLLRHTLRKLCAARGISPPAFSAGCMHRLLNYPYPGNVRELENILEHALILGGTGPLEEHHLPDYLRLERTCADAAPSDGDPSAGGAAEERRRIADLLRRFKGHRGKTARALGIERTTLWRRMKRFDLI